MEALQQRVVQLPRDAHALVDAFVEASLVLTRDLANAPPIPSPHETEGRDDDERLEPPCLVIRRCDQKASVAPVSFHTPLLLLSTTRKR